ncbi:hypothetical protein [Amantichitinum ursilacus]|uniref:Uncharacterized protein n=1 Tax=Amantichitinum ursilacus TaxID=857265 RepID=A0A0N0XM60_9NEIS|nr:hypothetical protein [Amantichitinum ursilacus]KPC54746.1 hypothetical protein WG78_04215 [Amantichitinum ursilacus]
MASVFAVSALISLSAQAAGTLTAHYTSPLWNGSAIPAGQQCAKLGGAGATPGLNVFDIPAGSGALLLEFSERSGANLGRFIYTLPKGANSAQIPGIASNGGLPAGIKALGGDGGVQYTAPCTPGGHFVIRIKALATPDANAAVQAEGRLDMGKLP